MNLFYRALRALTRTTLQIYFKNISFSGREQLKNDGPRIITANHPASFLDACILACFLPGPLYFLVRGDVFHPWFRFFFRWTYQIPIYRFRDGFENMRRNTDTFQKVHEFLSQGKTVVIFAEGLTEYEKKLRPIQKGAARMALKFQNRFPNRNINIQPLGINYENIYRFRSAVHVHIGPAFQPRISEDSKRDIHLLTEKIASQLSNLVVHIEEARREPIYTRWARSEGLFSLPAAEAREAQFSMAARINTLSETKVDAEINDSVNFESGYIEKQGIPRPFSLKLQCSAYRLGFFLLFPFFFFPAWLSNFFAQKYFKHPSFQQSVAIGLGMFFYLFWMVIICFMFFIVLGSIWWSSGVLICFLIFGRYFAMNIWIQIHRRCV